MPIFTLSINKRGKTRTKQNQTIMVNQKTIATYEDLFEKTIKNTKFENLTVEHDSFGSVFMDRNRKFKIRYDPILNELGWGLDYHNIKMVNPAIRAEYLESCWFIWNFLTEYKKISLPQCPPSPLPSILQ